MYAISAIAAGLSVKLLKLSTRFASAVLLDIDAAVVAFGTVGVANIIAQNLLFPIFGAQLAHHQKGKKDVIYNYKDARAKCIEAVGLTAGIIAGVVVYGALSANPYARTIRVATFALSLPGLFKG